MPQKSLTDLYHYFDSLLAQNNDDLIFASSYVRGFVAVEAVAFGDDEQVLSLALYQQLCEKIQLAESELTLADQALVKDFLQQIKLFFIPCDE